MYAQSLFKKNIRINTVVLTHFGSEKTMPRSWKNSRRWKMIWRQIRVKENKGSRGHLIWEVFLLSMLTQFRYK